MPNRDPYRKSIIFPIVIVYRLSTAIIYSTAYRLPIWIAHKISYKHSLYFGIPSVYTCTPRAHSHRHCAVPRRMRNDYRVKQMLPKRVDVAPPPVRRPLPHHSHHTKFLFPPASPS